MKEQHIQMLVQIFAMELNQLLMKEYVQKMIGNMIYHNLKHAHHQFVMILHLIINVLNIKDLNKN